METQYPNFFSYLFSFIKGSDIVAQSQADVCRLRFNSTMVTTLLAINRHVDTPGFPLYSSGKCHVSLPVN